MIFKKFLNFLFKSKTKIEKNNSSIKPLDKIIIEKEIPFYDTLFLSYFNYVYIQDDSLDLLKIKIECDSSNKDFILIEKNSISKIKDSWIQGITITIYGKIPNNLILNNFAKFTIEKIQTTNIQNISLRNDSRININFLNIQQLNLDASERSFFYVNQLFSKNFILNLNNAIITLYECFDSNIILKGHKFNLGYQKLNNSQITISEKK